MQELRKIKNMDDKPSIEKFVGSYGCTGQGRSGVTSKEYRDLFIMQRLYSLVHYVATDLNSRRSIARVFDKLFGERKELMSQRSIVEKLN